MNDFKSGICFKKWRTEFLNKPFLIGDDVHYTYGQAADIISRTTLTLKEKLRGHHEVVPLLIDNSAEFVFILLAVMAAGYIPYPLQPQSKPLELEGKLLGLEKALCLTDEVAGSIVGLSSCLSVKELLNQTLVTNVLSVTGIPGNARLICGTSGTTENQKKVVLQADRMMRNAFAHAQSLDLAREERILSVLPFYHGFTLMTHLFSVLGLNATFVIGKSTYPPSIARLVKEFGVTYTSFVPSLLDVIVNNYSYEMFEGTALRKISVGSAPASFGQLLNYRNYFKDQTLFLTYGQTEAGPRITTLRVNDADEEKLKSVGKLISGTEVRIDCPDDHGIGELQVKADWQMLGYYKDADASSSVRQEEWLKTGDLARVDIGGYVFLCGRKKDLIISGGVNISPMEIESVLNSIPEVKESMVLPVPDKKRGEVPHAFVVPSNGCSEGMLLEIMRGRLHHLKVPKKITFVNQIQKNHVGKPDRKAMSRLFAPIPSS